MPSPKDNGLVSKIERIKGPIFHCSTHAYSLLSIKVYKHKKTAPGSYEPGAVFLQNDNAIASKFSLDPRPLWALVRMNKLWLKILKSSTQSQSEVISIRPHFEDCESGATRKARGVKYPKAYSYTSRIISCLSTEKTLHHSPTFRNHVSLSRVGQLC